MFSKNHKPTADQKRWHSWIRDHQRFCPNCAEYATDLHHVIGSAGKHDKQWIGQWAVCMLCYRCNHDDLRLPKKRAQLDRFVLPLIDKYVAEHGDLPEGMDIFQHRAIQEWHR